MEALIVLTLVLGLFWVVILRPQQRRVRAHQQLVASLQDGDEVVLTAGIFGRITRLGPEQLDIEVAPGVELRVARQAVLRRVEHVVGEADEDRTDATDTGHATDTADAVPTAPEDEPETHPVDSGADRDDNADRPDGDRTTS